jgi:hypothetical protein
MTTGSGPAFPSEERPAIAPAEDMERCVTGAIPGGLEGLLQMAAENARLLDDLLLSREATIKRCAALLSESERRVLYSIPAPRLQQMIDHMRAPDPARRSFLRVAAASVAAFLAGAALSGDLLVPDRQASARTLTRGISPAVPSGEHCAIFRVPQAWLAFDIVTMASGRGVQLFFSKHPHYGKNGKDEPARLTKQEWSTFKAAVAQAFATLKDKSQRYGAEFGRFGQGRTRLLVAGGRSDGGHIELWIGEFDSTEPDASMEPDDREFGIDVLEPEYARLKEAFSLVDEGLSADPARGRL